MRPVDRLLYAVSQGTRSSMFLAQYLLSARLTSPPRIERPIAHPMPDLAAMLSELRRLFRRDWRNIEAGYYRRPRTLAEPPARLVANTMRYFRDLPAVDARRQRNGHSEVRDTKGNGAEGLPRYYLQNFHFQTDGYLSEHSARLYDHQVDVLFLGGADAMRRQALVPIHRFLKDRRAADVHLVDAGCGTGRFLAAVKQNYPVMATTAVDLSPHYLKAARRLLRRRRKIKFTEATMEKMPLDDGCADLVTCVFVFHELPKKVRASAVREFARVLRPGGRVILLDSLQAGDDAFFDGLIEFFPQAYHEPYYADYARTDLVALFDDTGLHHCETDLAFLSKLMVFEKPADAEPN